ncbi:MAG TPA: peptide chain release factor N(5)-glutamine methyltransferase [Vicinamibacteria bacterium]|nr:peptide chain release factor N(5)-glutamine methyltransferase [Vicinamibacteria bacterium]
MPRPRSSRTRSRARPRPGKRPGEARPTGPTVFVLLQEATSGLAQAGIGTARLDAELLLRHVLGWSRADLIARGAETVSPEAALLFRQAVAQRSQRRPLQHLTGVQAFWKHEFLVTPDVLIPRPETELLVETALELLRDVPRPVIVDVGTGSGCIALSLAAERPDAEVHAIDLSEAALRVARGNATRLRLAGRVGLHQGDLLAPVRGLAGRVDLVVSNPPYVPEDEWERLEPEVRDHDPRLALVPPEGVEALYGRLVREAVAVLRSGGWLSVELGLGGAELARGLLERAGLEGIEVRKDLQGIPRVAQGRVPAHA